MNRFGQKQTSHLCRALSILFSIHLALAGGSWAEKANDKDVAGKHTRLEKITFSQKRDGTLIRLYSEHPFQYITYKLNKPLRFALEIGEVTLGFEPKRTPIKGKGVSHISVVPFPEINSARVELELYAESAIDIKREDGWLEIFVSNPTTAQMNILRRSGITAKTSNKKGETSLTQRNKASKKRLSDAEIIDANKKIEQLKMEKDSLRKEIEENQKRYEEASGKAETLQARVEFMEKQLQKIRTNLPDKNSSELPGSNARNSEKIAGPDGSGGLKINSPKDDIEKMVLNWLDAWRKEEIKSYGGYYSETFKFGNKNRQEWIEGKKATFRGKGKPKILIGKLEIDVLSERFARAQFAQTYRSSRFNSKGVKTLSLTKESGVWKILSEDWRRVK